MFALPPIPVEKSEIWQFFKNALQKFLKKDWSVTDFQQNLQEIFAHNRDCPIFLISVIELLLAEAFNNPIPVYDFCKNKIPNDYWQVYLTYLQLVPQLGLTNFELLQGVTLHCAACELARRDGTIPLQYLKTAVKEHNSFPALLWLHDYYCLQLKSGATNTEKFEEMFQDLSQGKIHGTPTYILLASFCFWRAWYRRESHHLSYQLAIAYLICADRLRFHPISVAAMQNAYYIRNLEPIGCSKEAEKKYSFFDLLAKIKEGKARDLLNEIQEKSGFKDPDIKLAHTYGLRYANEFLECFGHHEQPPTLTNMDSVAPVPAATAVINSAELHDYDPSYSNFSP